MTSRGAAYARFRLADLVLGITATDFLPTTDGVSRTCLLVADEKRERRIWWWQTYVMKHCRNLNTSRSAFVEHNGTSLADACGMQTLSRFTLGRCATHFCCLSTFNKMSPTICRYHQLCGQPANMPAVSFRMHTQSGAAQQAAQQQSLRYRRELFENYLHASNEVLVIVHNVPKPKGMEDWLARQFEFKFLSA